MVGPMPPAPTDPGAGLNLKQAAAALGVHYMTAYRYVRQGRLEAHRVGTAWIVEPDAVARFRSAGPGRSPVGEDVDWSDRLVTPLLAGDEPAAWSVIERALAAGRDPASCYLDVIGGALAAIDARHTAGTTSASQQPLATAVAHRLVARLGGRFRRPGRSRGTVVFGAPAGERHSLPIAIVADLVRWAGFDVLELGPDLPPEAFAAAVVDASRLIAVGIGVTSSAHLEAARDAIAAIRDVDDAVPIVVGGQAVLSPEVAGLLDATAWAPDGRRAVEVIESFAGRSRRTRGSGRPSLPTDRPIAGTGHRAT